MRAVQTTILVLPVLLGAACENGPPWGDGDTPQAEVTAADFGPTAAYDRRLIFLGAGGTLPTAAIFDFVALSDSIGIRRGARGRVVDGAGWRVLMDAGWEMEPMREPWRLVPHGSLKLLVGDGGDLAALLYRDSATIRLQLGATLAEHSPDVGTQLVLRSARLLADDDSVPGILLDAQLGRAVNPSVVTRAAGATGGADPATPIARPGAEALLLDNAGYYVVLAGASGGSLAWVRSAGQNDVRPGARLEPTAWSDADEAGVQVPAAWRIVSVDGELAGELTARSTDRVALEGSGDLEALSYALVTGWIEDRQARRDVFGLVRHVR